MKMLSRNAFLWLRSCMLLLLFLTLTACTELTNNLEGGSTKTEGDLLISKSASSTRVSWLELSLSGAEQGEYKLISSTVTSSFHYDSQQMRIVLTDGEQSLLISFYGYTGPGSYTLEASLDQAAVQLSLGPDHPHWDLSAKEAASCQLIIESEVRTDSVTIHRISGAFACIELRSNTAGFEHKTIVVRHGSFDIAIIVKN